MHGSRPSAKLALRISAGPDGGEYVPLGFPGVEECADPVVAEPSESERYPFDPSDQLAGSFGGPVRHVRFVPGGDLVLPADDGRPRD